MLYIPATNFPVLGGGSGSRIEDDLATSPGTPDPTPDSGPSLIDLAGVQEKSRKDLEAEAALAGAGEPQPDPTPPTPVVPADPTDPTAVPGYEPTAFDRGAQVGTDAEGNPIYERQDPAAIRGGQDFVSPESTVAGQLEKIFAKDSPLQKLAKTRSEEQASALGMMSSSAGIGASQRALYDKGLEIAKPDAATYAAAKMEEQKAYNTQSTINREAQVAGDLTVQKARIAERVAKNREDFDIKLQDMAQEDRKEITELTAAFDKESIDLTGEINAALAKTTLDAEIEAKIMLQTGEMLNEVQQSWQMMVTSDDYLNNFENRADMLVSLNQQLAPVKASMVATAQMAGIYDSEFAGWINTMIENARYT